MQLTLPTPENAGRAAAPANSRRSVPPLPLADWAWFLDIDGTVVRIAETPDHVRVAPPVLELLAGVSEAAHGALALVSGRKIDAIDRLFAPHRFPVAGQHGVERRDRSGGLHRLAAADSRFRDLVERAHAWAARHPGILIEDKGVCVAVHYRRAPRLASAAASFARSLVRDCAGDFELQHGKMVYEIKPAGCDKGGAVRQFAMEAPFRGRRPVFIGDDASDESAFAAVNEMAGVSIKVGPGPTRARWRLAEVSAVLDYLARVIMLSEEVGPLRCGAGRGG